jgi:hypothetical protein
MAGFVPLDDAISKFVKMTYSLVADKKPNLKSYSKHRIVKNGNKLFLTENLDSRIQDVGLFYMNTDYFQTMQATIVCDGKSEYATHFHTLCLHIVEKQIFPEMEEHFVHMFCSKLANFTLQGQNFKRRKWLLISEENIFVLSFVQTNMQPLWSNEKATLNIRMEKMKVNFEKQEKDNEKKEKIAKMLTSAVNEPALEWMWVSKTQEGLLQNFEAFLESQHERLGAVSFAHHIHADALENIFEKVMNITLGETEICDIILHSIQGVRGNLPMDQNILKKQSMDASTLFVRKPHPSYWHEKGKFPVIHDILPEFDTNLYSKTRSEKEYMKKLEQDCKDILESEYETYKKLISQCMQQYDVLHTNDEYRQQLMSILKKRLYYKRRVECLAQAQNLLDNYTEEKWAEKRQQELLDSEENENVAKALDFWTNEMQTFLEKMASV